MEEGSGSDSSGKATAGRRPRKHPGWNIPMVLISVTIAIVLLVMVFGLGDGRAVHDHVLSSGDRMTYTISGSDNGTAVDGQVILRVYPPGSSDGQTFGNIPYWVDTDQYLRDDFTRSTWVCDHRISTPWGNKTVSTYFEVVSDQGNAWDAFAKTCMKLTNVGIDSHIVYRSTYFSTEMVVSSELTSSNSSKIANADTRASEASAVSSIVVKDMPGSTNILGGNNGVTYTYGSFRVAEGQHVRFNLTALGGYFLIFSEKDLLDTEGTSQLHYQNEASLGQNVTGEVDKEMSSGTYWYCMSVERSAEGGMDYWFWGQ
jgi:hypothetical protein